MPTTAPARPVTGLGAPAARQVPGTDGGGRRRPGLRVKALYTLSTGPIIAFIRLSAAAYDASGLAAGP